MNENDKTPPGEGGASTGDVENQMWNCSNYTTYRNSVQFPKTTNELAAAASERIESDPARYAVHFQIWLSLTYAANAWPWPQGVQRD